MPPAPLVIVNHLSPEFGAQIAAHPSRPIVETLSGAAHPWEIRADADVLITRLVPSWVHASAQVPQSLPDLKWVQTRSAGIDIYPKWLLEGRIVSTGKGLTSPYIAEYAMAAILHQLKPLAAHRVTEGIWHQRPFRSLIGTKIAVFGYGSIGQEFIRRALAFGAEIRVMRRTASPSNEPGLTFVQTLQELLSWADHLLLAAPLTAETRGLFNRDVLMQAKPGLHLINVSRGEVIEDAGLIAALDAGVLSAATLDVLAVEPADPADPLLTHPKVLVTPHISWSGGDPDGDFAKRMLRNIDHYLAGREVDFRIDIARGY